MTIESRKTAIPLKYKFFMRMFVSTFCAWAIQRLYEVGEDRYAAYLWPSFHLVQDIDDQRAASYGVYYTQKNR